MDETEAKIKKYIDILKEQLDIQLVVIFGSYLTHRYSEESDIDMLVVASEFDRMKKLQAFKLLSRPIWQVRLNIEPIPATPGEISNYSRASFLAEIFKKGKVIYKKSGTTEQ